MTLSVSPCRYLGCDVLHKFYCVQVLFCVFINLAIYDMFHCFAVQESPKIAIRTLGVRKVHLKCREKRSVVLIQM